MQIVAIVAVQYVYILYFLKRVFVPNICKFEDLSILRCMLHAIFCALMNKWLRFNSMPVCLFRLNHLS